ncbi:MAG: EndoU domain-containing protein [Pseudomonadota bacterium]
MSRKLSEPKNLFGLALLLFSLSAGYSLIDTHELADEAIIYGNLSVQEPANDNIAPPSVLKADWDHILHGDETGGGHLYGTGIPCKSEFPADWDENKVKSTVKRLAANDNANWRQEDNGYIVSDQRAEQLNVRVVINPRSGEIVTSYPTNVQRNPCNR